MRRQKSRRTKWPKVVSTAYSRHTGLAERPECPDVKNYKWRLNPVWHRMLYSCTDMATVGVKVLKFVFWRFFVRCFQCGEVMAAGDVAVSTVRSVDVPTAAWHVDCFTCSKCHEPLVNLVHFWSTGQLYCGRHHAETVRPRCFACDEASVLIQIYWQIYPLSRGDERKSENFEASKYLSVISLHNLYLEAEKTPET